MKLAVQKLTLTTVFLSPSASAMATVAAPAPEIGDGMVGAIVAVASLLAVVLYPRLKKSWQPK